MVMTELQVSEAAKEALEGTDTIVQIATVKPNTFSLAVYRGRAHRGTIVRNPSANTVKQAARELLRRF